MFGSRMRRGFGLAIAVLIGTSACADLDQAAAPPDQLAPQAQLLAPDGEFRLVRGMFPSPMGNAASCDVRGVERGDRLQSAVWIDQRGGVVTVLGGLVRLRIVAHVLTVPPRAVSGRTLFCMKLEPTNHMQVRLYAHALDAEGNVIDVGGAGFNRPVVLALSAVTVDLSSSLMRRLVVVYDPENGSPLERTTSFSLWPTATVIAELDHFSKYAMAVD